MNEDVPLDPFAGDPHDPAAEMADLFDDDPGEDEEALPPLTPVEREEIVADLADLDAFEQLLTPRGIRGLVVDCHGCEEQHYFAWELLRGNLRHLLDAGQTRVHEPAHAPDPDHYVTWDYARGFADGIVDAAAE